MAAASATGPAPRLLLGRTPPVTIHRQPRPGQMHEVGVGVDEPGKYGSAAEVDRVLARWAG